MMIKEGYLFSATKPSLIGDIRDGIEKCKGRGLVPDTVELNPYYEPAEFTGMKIIFTKKMPVGQVLIGVDDVQIPS
jgi:hypothetical protein